jgi:hypothetical protein
MKSNIPSTLRKRKVSESKNKSTPGCLPPIIKRVYTRYIHADLGARSLNIMH